MSDIDGLKRLNELSENSDKLDIKMDPVPYIEVRGFAESESILHGFTTKLGGVSKGIYSSLNLGFKTDDSKEDIITNYKLLGESMGFDHKRLSLPDQVHRTEVIVVGEEDAGDGIGRELTHIGVDGQITNVKNLPLIVFTADCVPILLNDPVKGVIGTVHAGWRGTVNGIAAKAVAKMKEVYGCEPGDIRAAVGPSIGPENYEVDDVVVNAIRENAYVCDADVIRGTGEDGIRDLGEDGIRDLGVDGLRGTGEECAVDSGCAVEILRPSVKEGRYMLDLWKLNELIMIKVGLKRENIFQTGLCTMKYHDIFYSHRYTNGKRGLQAGVIMLK